MYCISAWAVIFFIVVFFSCGTSWECFTKESVSHRIVSDCRMVRKCACSVRIIPTLSRWELLVCGRYKKWRGIREFWEANIKYWISVCCEKCCLECHFLMHEKGFSGLRKSTYRHAEKPVRTHETGFSASWHYGWRVTDMIKTAGKMTKTEKQKSIYWCREWGIVYVWQLKTRIGVWLMCCRVPALIKNIVKIFYFRYCCNVHFFNPNLSSDFHSYFVLFLAGLY